ncbi:zinc ribbon domain-containing protein [Halospeciosus flavus]|uniref:Zinc ribbon domain-containing protein n=1 Tax=Halospeciosus flavus TaxID=3032283 RepID=A0ABD5YYQ1_9EURY|nr:zinc ribbon domain-containing protein [Halospeciosus flavus]
MPYCPNCGSQIKAVHHYCGSCGQVLSEIAESESDPPMAVDRDGFLSLRSLSYVNELLGGEQELDRDSVSYTQLSREVSAAFADFARLAMVNDLDLLQLWATGSNTNALSKSVDDMNNNQFQEWLAAIGLGRTLRMYDDALHTEFEDEFDDRLQKLIEVANEELDDGELSE